MFRSKVFGIVKEEIQEFLEYKNSLQKINEYISSNTKSSIKYEELELDFFASKVGLLESAPIKAIDQTQCVFFMPGWGGAGGISEDLLPDRSKVEANYVMLQAQWPGTKRLLNLEEKYSILCQSSEIPKSAYNEIGKYYASLFLKLKERSGRKLRIVAHSNGALKALLGYFALKPEHREGISISLIDIFLPGEAFIFNKLYLVSYSLFKLANIFSPSYRGDLIDIITFPLTLPARIIKSVFNFGFGMVYKLIDNRNFKSNQAAELILNVMKDQEQMMRFLKKTENATLPIRDILVMAKAHITGEGFGMKKSYIDFLEHRLLPKISLRPDGSKVEIQKMPFGHSNFVGLTTAKEFWDWLEDSIARENPEET